MFRIFCSSLFMLFVAFSGIAEEVDLKYGQNQFVSGGVLFEVNKRRIEDKMTAHGYDSFEVKVNIGGEWVDLTLDNFRTIEGADCFVQDFIFHKDPFKIIRREREFGDSWIDAKPTFIITYGFDKEEKKLIQVNYTKHNTACDVRKLDK